uniref:Putative secreted protein n=1 Tax=Anopheles darlingi TaxID=43151 RepID=A0A2M4DE66_ANODA
MVRPMRSEKNLCVCLCLCVCAGWRGRTQGGRAQCMHIDMCNRVTLIGVWCQWSRMVEKGEREKRNWNDCWPRLVQRFGCEIALRATSSASHFQTQPLGDE